MIRDRPSVRSAARTKSTKMPTAQETTFTRRGQLAVTSAVLHTTPLSTVQLHICTSRVERRASGTITETRTPRVTWHEVTRNVRTFSLQRFTSTMKTEGVKCWRFFRSSRVGSSSQSTLFERHCGFHLRAPKIFQVLSEEIQVWLIRKELSIKGEAAQYTAGNSLNLPRTCK